MTKKTYLEISKDLEKRIANNEFSDGKLPSERVLSTQYSVNRTTIKRAIDTIVESGILYKKQGSGTYINKYYEQHYSDYLRQKKGPVGMTSSYNETNKNIRSKLLEYSIIKSPKIVSKALFISENEYVHKIERTRYVDDLPVAIEIAYVPIKLLPGFDEKKATGSLFQFAEKNLNHKISKSYISIYSDLATALDKKELNLKENEPITISEEIIFLENGQPFEYTVIRYHYKHFSYNSTRQIEIY